MSYPLIKKRSIIRLKIGLIIIILIFIFLIGFSKILCNNNEIFYEKENEYDYKNENPKNSWIWATLNLTNPSELNNTVFTHNTEIKVKGLLYNRINGTTQNGSLVVLLVDEIQYSKFNDTTTNGQFEINYTIQSFLNIYSKHKIEAKVISGIPSGGSVEYRHHYIIEVNATSYFDLQSYSLNSPQFAGGSFNLPNYLRFDNLTGIPYQQVNCSWSNETKKAFGSLDTFNTNADGSFKEILIPNDNSSKIMYFNITYIGNGTLINGTTLKLIPINVYRNTTCDWNTVSSAAEGNAITISGQMFDRTDSNHILNFTEFTITRNGDSIGSTITLADGTFSFSYQLPTGSAGINMFNVELSISSSAISNVSHIVSVSSPLIPPAADDIGDDDTNDETPPFQNFFLIFIPIIVGIVALLIVFGYFRFRKQEIESKLVKLPLEDRIRNFKILKDTGRLEEALSYLFQSIYMELVNAKYGKKKKDTETIRDFAIISVKEFKLNPTSIYPFIQNIEKVIYDKPFLIKEEDFYSSVQLFSPVYFELTGYHFVLNF